MAPLSPRTITRLDPTIPLLWRDEQTLQLGVDGDLQITIEGVWVEALLARMRGGFERRSFDVIAHAVGAPRADARALLARLRPLLVDDPAEPAPAWVESANLGDSRTEGRMRECLTEEGVPAGSRENPGHVGIVLVQGAAAALQLASYLRADLAHLPISFDAGGVTVGPLVRPGLAPCLACRDGHERDRDPAWPRLHAQLIGRESGPITGARVAEAARMAARLLAGGEQQDAEESRFVRITASGERVWRSLSFHAECRCRELSSRSPRGSATAAALRVPPSATTRATAYARPA